MVVVLIEFQLLDEFRRWLIHSQSLLEACLWTCGRNRDFAGKISSNRCFYYQN